MEQNSLRKKEIEKELIKMANRIGVQIPENEIEAFLKDPNHFIYTEYCENSNEPYCWRNQTNFNRTGFDTKRTYQLHQEYLKLKTEEK